MNKIILCGRLTKDPEVRFSNTTNIAFCKFTIAVDRRFKKQGEEKKTDFFNCTSFGKTGEFISKYFQKGSKILITGSVQNNIWQDQEGKKHYNIEIAIEEAEFVDSKKPNETTEQVPEEWQDIDEDELPF